MPYMFNAVSGGGFVLYHHHDPLFGCNDRENHHPLYNRLYFTVRESCLKHLLLDLRDDAMTLVVDLAITTEAMGMGSLRCRSVLNLISIG